MGSPSEQLLTQIEADKVASLPAVLIKLIEILNDPDASFDEIARLVRQDAALTSRILGVANSPAYAQWGKVDNVNRMLVVLGLEPLKTIIITSCVMEFFSKVEPKKETLMRNFWAQSLQCAHIAQSLARLTSYDNPDTAYLAGLLHKFGQLLYLHSFSDDYLIKIGSAENLFALRDLEQAAYGSSHQELAGWIIEQWEIDPLLADAVRYQLAETEAVWDAHPLVKILNLASKMAAGSLMDDDDLIKLGVNLFGLSADVLQSTLDKSKHEVASSASSFGINLDKAEIDQAEIDKQRLGLARMVRNIALIEHPGQDLAGAQSFDELLTTIYRNLKILFGISKCCLFIQQPGGQLKGIGPPRSGEQISRLSLSAENPNSLISRTLIDGSVLSSIDPPFDLVNVVDQQVMRAIGSDDILLIPLRSHTNLGVLIIGLDKSTDLSSSKKEMLLLFTNEISNALSKIVHQQEVEKEQELATLAEFHLQSRQMVHEANNPLSIIRNYLHLLGNKLGDTHPAQDELGLIKDEIDRVGKILIDFSSITGKEEETEAMEALDINTLVKQVGSLFQDSLFKANDIKLELQLDERMPSLEIDDSHIKQVLINLIKNAAEAMSDGGTVTLSTAANVNLDGKTFTEIRVTDTGPGLPDSVMTNLFTPVVSTKGKNHSGLGLTIAANLINGMKGRISCRSDSRGTEFQILLPRLAQGSRQ